MSGEVIRTINIGAIDTAPFGITTDEKYLWWVGKTNTLIVQMDKAGNVIRTIDVSGIDIQPTGISTDGKYLWWVGYTNKIIVQMNK